MREIKFRANNRIGNFLYSSDFDSLSEYFSECDMHGWECQEQYIQLHDIKAKEAYQGDIIKVTGFISRGDGDYGDEIFEIVWNPEQAAFMGREMQCSLKSCWYMEDCQGFEIIGNIHEEKQMREIKFRAWEKSSKEYLYDIMYSSNCDQIVVFFNGELNSTMRVMADKFIIEQYTGLKDKNGKEIYEGDIVEILAKFFNGLGEPSIKLNNHVVEYVAPSFCLLDRIDMNRMELQDYTEDVQIIGNIHES